jgi:hypothetical protein
MVFKEIITVYSGNLTKLINVHCGQNVGLQTDKPNGICSYQGRDSSRGSIIVRVLKYWQHIAFSDKEEVVNKCLQFQINTGNDGNWANRVNGKLRRNRRTWGVGNSKESEQGVMTLKDRICLQKSWRRPPQRIMWI